MESFIPHYLQHFKHLFIAGRFTRMLKETTVSVKSAVILDRSLQVNSKASRNTIVKNQVTLSGEGDQSCLEMSRL